jgi:uncharacterized protein
VTDLLYIDTSTLIRAAINEHDGQALRRRMREHRASGGRLVSSRLLDLEAERVATRFEVVEDRDGEPLRALARSTDLMPVTEEVWQGAYAIRQHVKTLDSLHLATCLLLDATLLTSDDRMRHVALELGIRVAGQE